ncbi:TIGR04255 family protein [Streptomyces sp. NPDC087422]|uniref:TIGR04255 family protein n=1 Tax=Streptomyces sp. NPDC087422 TaxID=3365786 RepID=UPI00380AEF09
MSPRQLEHPFGDEPCEEVPLASAPLARVLAQLRFEPLSALNSSNVNSKFAEELSEKYPYLDKASEISMLIEGGKVSPQTSETPVWQLSSASRDVTISLSNGSLTIETTKYRGRSEFCEDLLRAADALKRLARVPAYTRVGFRYTNRVVDCDLIARLPDLVRSEILGISAVALGERASLQHSLSQALFNLQDGNGLLVQWGQMPQNSTFDPSLLPIGEKSWILDLDSFYQNSQIISDVSSLSETINGLSERAYRFFRWAVTPTFLTEFGGS